MPSMQALRSLRDRCLSARERSEDGLGIYRTLVRNTLRDTLMQALPASWQMLGDQSERLFSQMLVNAPPRERLLRRLPAAFVRYALTVLDPRSPVCDLLRYESAWFAAECEGSRWDEEPTPGVLRVHPSVQLVTLCHAVHLDDWTPDAPALSSPLVVLLHRDDATDEVHTLTLAPRTALLLEALLQGHTPDHALAVATEGSSSPAAAMHAAIAQLQSLIDRGVLLVHDQS